MIEWRRHKSSVVAGPRDHLLSRPCHLAAEGGREGGRTSPHTSSLLFSLPSLLLRCRLVLVSRVAALVYILGSHQQSSSSRRLVSGFPAVKEEEAQPQGQQRTIRLMLVGTQLLMLVSLAAWLRPVL